ncbi:hypothetical protein CTI12_AA534560 [Artemisia annua]|uniref:Uncharacterized protein n=1 Tax=Artemisia annua TaxID=35608 RepID=A0A2U1L3I3_ARTAN|nr:hypothetical protein CTI12_AA534560 [Artemisia annua]
MTSSLSSSSKHGPVNTNGNSYLPELRRTKSFSASKHEGLLGGVAAYEPQRKSCDVRGGRVVLETNVEETDVDDVIEEVEEVQGRVSGDRVDRVSRDADLEDSIVVEVGERENIIKHDVIEEKDDVIQDIKPMKDYLDLEGCGGGNNNKKKMTSTRSNFWYSFDEPRASWDGYLIGRTFPRLPPMVEDMPHAPVHVPVVPRCDMQIPVEEVRVPDGDVPGGSIQTREYYLDSSSSKRRKSLDRSNSIRKMAAAVVAELDESKVMPVGSSNSKVSPTNEPPRVSNSNSLRDDCSETFELGFRDNGIGVGFRDNGVGNGFRGSLGGEKKEMKKPRRWKWKLWGLIHRRGKDDDEDRCSSVSGVGRSYSESWQDGINGINGGMNRKVFRSNSSVSMRSSSLRKTNGHMNGKVIGNEQVFERNRSARYSPNHIDNGLLRFYLAPLSGSRRGGIGIATGKSRGSSNNSHSIARSMLRLY